MIKTEDQVSNTNSKRIELARLVKPIDITVFGTKVIVFPIEIVPKSISGGIELLKTTTKASEFYEDQPYQGIVVAINATQSSITDIQVGDLIYARSSANHKMMFAKNLYWIYDVSDIVCSIPNPKIK
jgi:co-chaperonin GroES (HSP10)